MNTANFQFNNLLDELFEVLDRDVEHFESVLHMLDELREMVIRRNEQNLQILLERASIAAERYSSTENRRKHIRKQLALICGCSVKDMTLTNLSEILDKNKRETVLKKKIKLNNLLLKLKTEQMGTSMLLAECNRFNSVMLNALLSGRQDNVTYNRSGGTNRHSKQNMVNLQL